MDNYKCYKLPYELKIGQDGFEALKYALKEDRIDIIKPLLEKLLDDMVETVGEKPIFVDN